MGFLWKKWIIIKIISSNMKIQNCTWLKDVNLEEKLYLDQTWEFFFIQKKNSIDFLPTHPCCVPTICTPATLDCPTTVSDIVTCTKQFLATHHKPKWINQSGPTARKYPFIIFYIFFNQIISDVKKPVWVAIREK